MSPFSGFIQKLSQSFSSLKSSVIFFFKEPLQYGQAIDSEKYLQSVGDWINRVPLLDCVHYKDDFVISRFS